MISEQEMKERPIIFNTENVKAILEGRKTQTRRVIKPQPPNWANSGAMNQFGRWDFAGEGATTHKISCGYVCPYGQVGNRLWVRETWTKSFQYYEEQPQSVFYKADSDILAQGNKWRPSIFMPRWASRITLEITDIRVERLQEITPHECILEGIIEEYGDGLILRDKFENLWDSLNAKRGYSWKLNPFVWVISFKRV